ncbi:type II toxin-antitoxin system RelE/ParE family toxin [bacterium]|nr:MAG: type II toxin-antitoxin system RelE/ParE family toxin [bacterium]MCL4230132.1 type II toxin-antitoxin system RelE/ParE family toxin [Dehalococcoidia bacterium]
MIASFGDRATEALYHGKQARRRFPPDVVAVALRKLDMLNSARTLADLRSPPGNRLEALQGDLNGFHSVRVNDQWRLVFRWHGKEIHEVRLTDYH